MGFAFLLLSGEVDMSGRSRISVSWPARSSRRGKWPAAALLVLLLSGPVPAQAGDGQARGSGKGHDDAVAPPAVALPNGPIVAGDWPCWRGPGGGGARAEPLPLLQWSEKVGVFWKVPAPGRGHASPIVVGDRILLATADETLQSRSVICYDRKTGVVLWETMFHGGAFMGKHAKNSHASPTPVCDGRLVYLPYAAGDALWLVALDLGTSRSVWQFRIGPFVSEWGYASSPVLFEDLVIVAGDNGGAPAANGAVPTSYLAAVDRRTGHIAWRVGRPLAPSYGTPVVARLAGRDQLLLSGAERITAYDPADGKELWFCRWSALRSANSVVCGADCVYASTTWPKAEVVCVRANGKGDVTESHVVWRQKQGATDVPAPLYHEGRLYLVNDRGIATCLDGATGQLVWEQRLGGAFSASPVLAGDRILATDEDGTTHVFKAGPRFEAMAKNSLNDPIFASPAMSGDRLFLRGRGFLWCLGRQEAPPQAPPALPPGTKVLRLAGEATGPAAAEERPAKSRGSLIAVGILSLTGLVTYAATWLIVARRRRAEDVPPGAPGLAWRAHPGAAAAPVTFLCSSCRKRLRVNAELAGRRVKCPQCSTAVFVPRQGPHQ